MKQKNHDTLPPEQPSDIGEDLIKAIEIEEAQDLADAWIDKLVILYQSGEITADVFEKSIGQIGIESDLLKKQSTTTRERVNQRLGGDQDGRSLGRRALGRLFKI